MNYHPKILLLLLLLVSHLLSAQVAPTANNDTITTEFNTTLVINAAGVLANDTDPDAGDVITVTAFSLNGQNFTAGETATFAQGNITIASDGSYTFTPANNFFGNIPVITYTITDETFTSSANLNISVLLQPPIAVDDTNTTEFNTVLLEDAPGVLSNDTDPDAGDILTVTRFYVNGVSFNAGETATFTQGSITIAADGGYTFTPTNNYIGNIPIIRYTITDGTFTSTANLNISVLSQPPIAVDDINTTEMNTPLVVNALGVLANDSDPDVGDIITVIGFSVNGIDYLVGETVSFPEGNITIASNGSYTYNPALNYTGDVSIITYTISDGTTAASANLILSVFETTANLLDIEKFGSCNQGFVVNGEYKVSYSIVIRNNSISTGNHPTSLVSNIDLTNNLNAAFGNGCVVSVDQVQVRNDNDAEDYEENPYPREFTDDAINPDFLNVTSTSVFNSTAIANLSLYPRQAVYVDFCVTINPFCNDRPNPTPAGSGINFNSTINATSNKGNDSDALLLTDFHTTEAIVVAGLHVPEFHNNSSNPPGVINPDGTYDYVNTVIITNEGNATANNINFNMGLGSFINNGITFEEVIITQVSGPPVTINNTYDGDTNTVLLAPNMALAAGETITLELFYLIGPYSSRSYSRFNQLLLSQTQGVADGFDESIAIHKGRYSFVTWSDTLGDHLDKYYYAGSPTATITSQNQCNCTTLGMRFLFRSSTETTKTITEVKTAPNGILEHEEITFQVEIENTSESVQLRNLQLEDDLNDICTGNFISVSTPIIISSTANTNPTLNTSFNGVSDINLFDGTSGLLRKDEIITIQYTVLLKENCIGENEATFTATNPINKTVRSSDSVDVGVFTDTDNDGIPNDVDLDDDNDTIPDVLEHNGLDPMEDDDADGTPNYRDTDYGADTNLDGIVDIFDFDNDGVPNHFDLDSDNDGIFDIVEVNNLTDFDTNSDGRTDNEVGSNGLDNSIESDDSFTATITYVIPNTDANGNPNFIDIDSDDDGIVDNIEAQPTNNYITITSVFTDTGIDTAYPNGINPVDTENDGIFDYIDINSDNDIRDDVIEGWDIDGDGIAEIIPLNIDSDNDGLDDAFDTNNNLVNPTNGQTPTSFPNVDNEDTPERDWREIIAIVVLITDVSQTEGEDFVFEITFVTKNNNSILIESASPVEISLSTENGTTTTQIYDVATAPFDYDAVNTAITIPPFTNTTQFTVTSLEDPIFELLELFTLNGSITSNNTLTKEIKGVGSIIDNDGPPLISMNNSREQEGIDLGHTIQISHPSSTPVIINVVTEDNLAISPDDYIAFKETFTIEGTVDPDNANTETSFSITSLTDNLNELDEEDLHVLGTVTSANVGVQDLTKTATIVDIDPNPFVAIDSITGVEGASFLFTIKLLNANLEPMQNYLPINFTLETIDDTATAHLDYSYVNKPTNIPAYTSSITQLVETYDDKLNEETETFYLQANVSYTTTSNTFPARGIGFIKDNDYPNLFSPNGDGKSDVFKISGIEDYPNFTLTIVNRLGNEVYNYSNNGKAKPIWWNGFYNGNPVPVGVYFYTLNFNDGITKPIRNFIQLIR